MSHSAVLNSPHQSRGRHNIFSKVDHDKQFVKANYVAPQTSPSKKQNVSMDVRKQLAAQHLSSKLKARTPVQTVANCMEGEVVDDPRDEIQQQKAKYSSRRSTAPLKEEEEEDENDAADKDDDKLSVASNHSERLEILKKSPEKVEKIASFMDELAAPIGPDGKFLDSDFDHLIDGHAAVDMDDDSDDDSFSAVDDACKSRKNFSSALEVHHSFMRQSEKKQGLTKMQSIGSIKPISKNHSTLTADLAVGTDLLSRNTSRKAPTGFEAVESSQHVAEEDNSTITFGSPLKKGNSFMFLSSIASPVKDKMMTSLKSSMSFGLMNSTKGAGSIASTSPRPNSRGLPSPQKQQSIKGPSLWDAASVKSGANFDTYTELSSPAKYNASSGGFQYSGSASVLINNDPLVQRSRSESPQKQHEDMYIGQRKLPLFKGVSTKKPQVVDNTLSVKTMNALSSSKGISLKNSAVSGKNNLSDATKSTPSGKALDIVAGTSSPSKYHVPALKSVNEKERPIIQAMDKAVHLISFQPAEERPPVEAKPTEEMGVHTLFPGQLLRAAIPEEEVIPDEVLNTMLNNLSADPSNPHTSIYGQAIVPKKPKRNPTAQIFDQLEIARQQLQKEEQQKHLHSPVFNSGQVFGNSDRSAAKRPAQAQYGREESLPYASDTQSHYSYATFRTPPHLHVPTARHSGKEHPPLDFSDLVSSPPIGSNDVSVTPQPEKTANGELSIREQDDRSQYDISVHHLKLPDINSPNQGPYHNPHSKYILNRFPHGHQQNQNNSSPMLVKFDSKQRANETKNDLPKVYQGALTPTTRSYLNDMLVANDHAKLHTNPEQYRSYSHSPPVAGATSVATREQLEEEFFNFDDPEELLDEIAGRRELIASDPKFTSNIDMDMQKDSSVDDFLHLRMQPKSGPGSNATEMLSQGLKYQYSTNSYTAAREVNHSQYGAYQRSERVKPAEPIAAGDVVADLAAPFSDRHLLAIAETTAGFGPPVIYIPEGKPATEPPMGVSRSTAVHGASSSNIDLNYSSSAIASTPNQYKQNNHSTSFYSALTLPDDIRDGSDIKSGVVHQPLTALAPGQVLADTNYSGARSVMQHPSEGQPHAVHYNYGSQGPFSSTPNKPNIQMKGNITPQQSVAANQVSAFGFTTDEEDGTVQDSFAPDAFDIKSHINAYIDKISPAKGAGLATPFPSFYQNTSVAGISMDDPISARSGQSTLQTSATHDEARTKLWSKLHGRYTVDPEHKFNVGMKMKHWVYDGIQEETQVMKDYMEEMEEDWVMP